jgi:hypothetical protein
MKPLHLILLGVFIPICAVFFLLMHYRNLQSFWLNVFVGLVWIPLLAVLNRKS